MLSPLHPLLPSNENTISWGNLHGCSISLAIDSAIAQSHKPLLIITEDTFTANRIANELAFFQVNSSYPILNFPDWETLPYDHFSPHQDIISDRLKALLKIPLMTQGAIIISVTTLMHRLAPKEYLEGHTFFLQQHEKLNIDTLRKRLERSGYHCVTQVREHGEFAVRGSIMDLFPMGSELPFRIDLLDDEIDSIRTFSPESQRTVEKVSTIELLPAKEFPLTEESIEYFRSRFRSEFSGNPLNSPLYQDISEGIATPGIEYYLPFFFAQTASLFDYLPKDCYVMTIGTITKHSEEFWQEATTRYTQYRYDISRPILPPEQIFIQPQQLQQAITQYPHIDIQQDATDIVFATTEPPTLSLDTLKNFTTTQNGRILLTAETTGRREILLPMLERIALKPKYFASWQDFLASNEPLGLTIVALDQGMVLTKPPLAIIAESQLFGKRILQSRRRKSVTQDQDAIIRDLTELQIGAPVVHIEHGVGRYLGLQILDVSGIPAEFLAIEYAGNDKLYVPVTSLHCISRYSGRDVEHAPLHRLGTPQFAKAKKKAEEQIRDVAADLLDIYAKRLAQSGFAHQNNEEQYLAFANAFPFEETPDQLSAIADIIQDMAATKPMDRLVCGDVGFGKTEVAMRAAFIAIQNNKQVAVLVPTTLLAQQHYQTFQDRFSDWPIKVEALSRFKTAKETQHIISDLQQGKVDIIIGTHKILQDKIKFKSLGLLIIDEEHRFGVQQKERLKALRATVDILTLTATPIPRTLNMAFSGIRDLSIIATPPAKRLSIKTFVQEQQNHLIHEAISREIMRGGQVYFLHNDIATIQKFTQDLMKLIPEARISFAHGQMHERELEQIMSDFYHRRFNVLVCTTIIESGIDIPSANTIIIQRADKFGLAQLHQLRGRVGRSHHQAYAYLLTPPRKLLTPDALKRLDAIAAYEDLGVGFTLATHDLEIRGAGELLGEGQSGNMQEIGFTLYMDLLSSAVDALKSGKTIDLDDTLQKPTDINLQLPALIPESFLGDINLRLQFYKRIASCKTLRELDDIQVEMIDRFGLLPQPLKNLFVIAELRQEAEKIGITKIEASAKGGRIEFIEKPHVDPMTIINLIQQDSKHFQLGNATTLKFSLDAHEIKDRIELIAHILRKLAAC